MLFLINDMAKPNLRNQQEILCYGISIHNDRSNRHIQRLSFFYKSSDVQSNYIL